LALDHKPLNLGQGFPDFAAPGHVTQALADAATSQNVLLNQYTRGFVSQLKNICYFPFSWKTENKSKIKKIHVLMNLTLKSRVILD
jgi:hypothetical protein